MTWNPFYGFKSNVKKEKINGGTEMNKFMILHWQKYLKINPFIQINRVGFFCYLHFIKTYIERHKHEKKIVSTLKGSQFKELKRDALECDSAMKFFVELN